VVGNIVSTAKYETLEGKKLLIVREVDGNRNAVGKPIIALDSVGAGEGEFVMIVESKEASVPFGGGLVPTDATIVGIIDSIGR
jgi:ethanolamine utilization protein EutN